MRRYCGPTFALKYFGLTSGPARSRYPPKVAEVENQAAFQGCLHPLIAQLAHRLDHLLDERRIIDQQVAEPDQAQIVPNLAIHAAAPDPISMPRRLAASSNMFRIMGVTRSTDSFCVGICSASPASSSSRAWPGRTAPCSTAGAVCRPLPTKRGL